MEREAEGLQATGLAPMRGWRAARRPPARAQSRLPPGPRWPIPAQTLLTTLCRLEEEVTGGGEEDGYLDAVVNETLRVRPVIDAVLRRLTRPVELAGYSLPAGTIVGASILGVQLSEAFERLQEFRAERFLKRPAPPYTLIPFGGGVHRCVGASFAVMEMKALLRTVIERVELRAAFPRSEPPVRWRRFTVMPARGGRVIATPRGGSG